MKPATSIDLPALTRIIVERQVTIDCFEAQARDAGDAWLRAAILQGKDLLRVKVALVHGEWLPWLSKHFGKSVRRAQVYMKLAANTSHATHLESAGSMNKALALIGNGDEKQQPIEPKTKPWPSYIQALGKCGKFVQFVESHPIKQWPTEGVEQLREDLLPIVSALWPDKFSLQP